MNPSPRLVAIVIVRILLPKAYQPFLGASERSPAQLPKMDRSMRVDCTSWTANMMVK